MRLTFATLLACFLSSVGCQSQAPVGEPVGKMKDRKLGFGVTEGNIGYELSFAAAKHAGLQFIELPQQWDEVARADGTFDSEFAVMANEVYPALDTSLVLSLNPIDTTANRLPAYLQGEPWDSLKVIDAFNAWFDWTVAQLPDATIEAVSVGNEVDAYLSANTDEMEAYKRFFEAVRDHIRSTHDVPVGCKMTFGGRTGELSEALAKIDQSADALMLTYYPLDDQFRVRSPKIVPGDIAKMLSFANDRPVFILETGYPSGSECGSSLESQAEFIDELFAAWDRNADQVPLINLVWTCDMPTEQVTTMVKYYGVESDAFQGYLATLGLRSVSGENKPAFERVRYHVGERSK